MAKQLVYTSVPKGLRAGTAGFTTVAMSPDLDPLLVSRLERLSSYPGEQVGRSGCTALRSHMVVEAGSQPVHVLACVSTAPTDYSGRSNFIAHYLILDPEERPAVGPAALLEGAAAPFLRGWEGDPRYLDDLQLPQRPARAPARCTAWEHISADPGWGGFFIDRSRRGHAPQFVIYGPDVDPITLIGESIALLAPRRRWDVTFSTMASGGASTDSCEWRWMPAGSRAASDLPVSVGRLDLTGRVGEPPPGPGVDAARSGSLVPDGSVVLSLAPERASLRLSIGEDPDSGEMENPDLLDSADACRPVFAPSSARRMVVMVALGTGTAIAAIVALVLLLVPISGPDIESDGDGQRLGTTELEQSVKAPTGLPASALTEDLSTGNEKRPVQSNAQKDPDAPRGESGWVARNIDLSVFGEVARIGSSQALDWLRAIAVGVARTAESAAAQAPVASHGEPEFTPQWYRSLTGAVDSLSSIGVPLDFRPITRLFDARPFSGVGTAPRLGPIPTEARVRTVFPRRGRTESGTSVSTNALCLTEPGGRRAPVRRLILEYDQAGDQWHFTLSAMPSGEREVSRESRPVLWPFRFLVSRDGERPAVYMPQVHLHPEKNPSVRVAGKIKIKAKGARGGERGIAITIKSSRGQETIGGVPTTILSLLITHNPDSADGPNLEVANLRERVVELEEQVNKSERRRPKGLKDKTEELGGLVDDQWTAAMTEARRVEEVVMSTAWIGGWDDEEVLDVRVAKPIVLPAELNARLKTLEALRGQVGKLKDQLGMQRK